VHHYRFAVKTAIEQLRQRGYRRFGLAYAPRDEQRLQDGWTGGFRIEEGRRLEGESYFYYAQPEPFIVEKLKKYEAHFLTWYERYRPEAIVSPADWVARILRERIGLPQNAGFAHLALAPSDKRYAGIEQQLDEVGAAAIDLLAAMIHQNEYGLPRVPKTIVLEGRWVDGPSLEMFRS
jgi:DNA-binding LacI/PurR family transcriptional regulator